MDKLIEKKKSYRPEMREGKKVDMEKLLGEMDSQYLSDLDASISSFDTYEEISSETYNDYKIVFAQLYLLHKLEYLTEEEAEAMKKAACDMRLKKLEGVDHGEN